MPNGFRTAEKKSTFTLFLRPVSQSPGPQVGSVVSGHQIFMSKHWTIIDGHNSLHSVGRYRALLDQDYSTALSRLLSDIAGAPATTDSRLTVVFDGKAEGKPYAGEYVDIVFSEERTADELIEKLARSAPEGTAVTVVTADIEHMRAVSSKGVVVVKPALFFAELLEAPKETPRKGPGRVSLEDRLPDDVRDKLERLRRGEQ